jgi:hypothetical protein
MNDSYLHNIQIGDLVKIRSPGTYRGLLAVVLTIEPSHRTVAHHMHEVEVLIAEVQRAFMMYELEKV